jgi:SanA protein
MLLLSCIALSAIMLGFAKWVHQQVEDGAKSACFQDVQAIPHRRVGLVLGTGKWMSDGQMNLFYRFRLQAARELFVAGKVDFLLVSGDNGRPDYDEPSMMTDDLVAMGLPRGRIYQDFAGFRTLDSVIRAQKVFGLNEVTFISQRFHNERALFLAKTKGMSAIAFDARTVGGIWQQKMDSREYLSRTVGFLETHLWNKQPRYLGPKIEIGPTLKKGDQQEVKTE